jgi:hypothetical protein
MLKNLDLSHPLIIHEASSENQNHRYPIIEEITTKEGNSLNIFLKDAMISHGLWHQIKINFRTTSESDFNALWYQ